TEGPPALAVLHLAVHLVLDPGEDGVGEDRAAAERACAELHASLEPADDLARGDVVRGAAHDVARLLVRHLAAVEGLADVGVREPRPVVYVLELVPDAIAVRLGDDHGGADGRPGVVRGGLDEDALDRSRLQELAVHLAVEADAAGDAEATDAVLLDRPGDH